MPKTLPVDPCRAPIKRGRPQRETPYVLPPLPSKNSCLATRQKTKQKETRALLQNNAASLRYRRSQKLKHQQQQLQFEELFRKNASLHSTKAKLKKNHKCHCFTGAPMGRSRLCALPANCPPLATIFFSTATDGQNRTRSFS